MSTAPSPPDRSLRGDRALAIRVIGETGARAAARPFAAALHPSARGRPIDLGLARAPRDIIRRGLRRVDRFVVRHAGGVLLAVRRTDRAEAVRQVHRLDHRCFELEQRVASLEKTLGDSDDTGDGS